LFRRETAPTPEEKGERLSHVKQRRKEIPLICSGSHSGGRKKQVRIYGGGKRKVADPKKGERRLNRIGRRNHNTPTYGKNNNRFQCKKRKKGFGSSIAEEEARNSLGKNAGADRGGKKKASAGKRAFARGKKGKEDGVGCRFSSKKKNPSMHSERRQVPLSQKIKKEPHRGRGGDCRINLLREGREERNPNYPI